jgi:hypothetical protein
MFDLFLTFFDAPWNKYSDLYILYEYISEFFAKKKTTSRTTKWKLDFGSACKVWINFYEWKKKISGIIYSLIGFDIHCKYLKCVFVKVRSRLKG